MNLNIKRQVQLVKKKKLLEVVEQFSPSRIQLDMMTRKSTKQGFATISTDFCEAKISVYDCFRFETKKCFFFYGNLTPHYVSLVFASVIKMNRRFYVGHRIGGNEGFSQENGGLTSILNKSSTKTAHP